MKKLFTYFSILIPLFISAQVPKMVLYEGFTSASCVPCSQQDPVINALIKANLDKVVPLKYHVSWFGPDPMNSHNQTEVSNRTSYYSVNSTPSSRMNGQNLGVSQHVINTNYDALNGAFAIEIDAEIDEDWETVSVKVDVTALQNISATGLRTRIAIVEREIIFETPPGTANSTDFFYVMKKFLPNTNGHFLAPPLFSGDKFTFEHTWEAKNVYNIPELSVVVFIQSDTDKSVWQAGIANVKVPVPHDINVVLVETRAFDNPNHANTHVCDFKTTPGIKIRNEGNLPLTTASIKYKINDGVYRYYNWNGNLLTYETEWVDLPETKFFHSNNGENLLYVEVKLPNGVDDEFPDNNIVEYTFETAKNTSGNINYKLVHDQYSDEITWELKNSSGQTIYSGGPYLANAAGTKEYTFNLINPDCYTFIIYDEYGDGQIGNNVGVTLTDLDNSEIIIQNYAKYGFEGRVVFGVNSHESALVPDSADVFYSSISDIELVSEFKVFPNPAADFINIQLTATRSTEFTVHLTDLLGRKITSGYTVNGNKTFNTSQLSNGIYFFKVVEQNKIVAVSRFVISR